MSKIKKVSYLRTYPIEWPIFSTKNYVKDVDGWWNPVKKNKIRKKNVLEVNTFEDTNAFEDVNKLEYKNKFEDTNKSSLHVRRFLTVK